MYLKKELSNEEWLVSNRRGLFAMGTLQGPRTRKYHGYMMGIPGRTETAFLSELEFSCNGVPLWPQGNFQQNFSRNHSGPCWKASLQDGEFFFGIERGQSGGIVLFWEWKTIQAKSSPLTLEVRSYWAMRDLHGLGGKEWAWTFQAPNLAVISQEDQKKAYCYLKGEWSWKSDPKWSSIYSYVEEQNRGYESEESLFSAGTLEVRLSANRRVEWVLGLDEADLSSEPGFDQTLSSKVFDFLLVKPSGIVAGFPWFGEWGRDTFISLPGMVATSFSTQNSWVQSWAMEVLLRWGSWIEKNGMIPNVLEKSGNTQWESADATLWWCHALASLWAYSQCGAFQFDIQREFEKTLIKAIQSIEGGNHFGLRPVGDSWKLLEVTEPRATWMDAQVEGHASTPRVGKLPEINALWFQTLFLQKLWNKELSLPQIKDFGAAVLECREPQRPNEVFFHSLPLAPTFVLKDNVRLKKDVAVLTQEFLTPYGLRTLSPLDAQYHPTYGGSQSERDQSYHQGPAWGWLMGPYQIAVSRLSKGSDSLEGEREENMEKMPIQGHIPELFDGEPPFLPRGAPAQAWSLACLEEAKAYRRLKLDSKLSHVLSQRWLGREERKKKETKCDPQDKSVY